MFISTNIIIASPKIDKLSLHMFGQFALLQNGKILLYGSPSPT